uniref:Uncharacterized protein n=1 Tax=Megaselia scalaris TaxID=36166 RepID=T1H348_MEGSC
MKMKFQHWINLSTKTTLMMKTFLVFPEEYLINIIAECHRPSFGYIQYTYYGSRNCIVKVPIYV